MAAARQPAFWAGVIAVCFFVINLSQIGRYGLSYDEPTGMERGRQTVAIVVGMFRPAGGEEENHTHEWLHNHPSFYATCNYGVSSLLTRCFGWRPIPAGHFLNVLTASAGLVLVFRLGKLLFNPVVGLVAEVFMGSFPRFIANAHFNGKDIPVMVMSMLALLLLNMAARQERTRYWILAGVAAALAVVTKLDGLFVLPIFFIPWLIRSLPSENRFSDLRKMGWCLGTSALLVFLLWPELWRDPLHLFRSVSNFSAVFRTGSAPYLGHVYPMAHLPWHYNIVEFMAVTPLICLAVGGVGSAGSLCALLKRQHVFEHSLIWFWILVPIVPRMFPGVIRYEGMRHIFLVVPAVAIVAGFGVDRLLSHWKGQAGWRFAPIIFCGAIAWSGWQIIECHPYEAFYLNEAVRWAIPAPKFADYFDFYGWGSLYTQGVQWLNSHAPPRATVWIGGDASMLHNYGLREDLQPVEYMDKADYVLVGRWSGSLMENFRYPPVFSLPCYGVDLLRVYARNPNTGR